MDAEFAAKWVADLRTPGLKQADSCLFDGEGYCCLGRAEVVAGSVFVENSSGSYGIEAPDDDVEGEIHFVDTDLTKATQKLAGMHSRSGYRQDRENLWIDGGAYACLASANDDGVSFALIADYIEANHAFL